MNTKFTSTVGTLINLETANQLRANHSTQKGSETVVNSIFFGKDVIQQLLNQENAVGLRIHFGKDENGATKLVIFPSDENGQDIPVKINESEVGALDEGLPCPPIC